MTKPIDLINILKREVVPALGCTDPIAVALAAATAKSKTRGNINKITVQVSPNIYKNSMAVGIPGVSKKGIKVAAALGAIAGDPSLKLEVLANISTERIGQALNLVEEGRVDTKINSEHGNLYIEVEVETDTGTGKCKIRNRHEGISCIEANGKILFTRDVEDESEKSYMKDLQNLTIKELVENVEALPYQSLEFMLEGARMNKAIANEGLQKELGMGVGSSILKGIERGLYSDDIYHRTVLLTAAGSDARMSGYQMPVMSSAGSGNHGLTAILPVISVAEFKDIGDEKLARALAISHLVTVYIKSFTGNLSALCGCAVAAATGASAAIVWLLGGTYKQIDGSIKNMIADLSGVICDGAKVGCALKLSTAAGVALKSAFLALDNVIASEDNGIVTETVEQTIKNLGRIGTPGMVETDKEILDVMITCANLLKS